MKLKKIKKTTRVRIKNKDEYFLLMELLEEAGYVWACGEPPKYFNNRNDYTKAEVVELLENKHMYTDSSGIHGNEKPLRKVVEFEVGDTVRVREDLEKLLNKDGASSITKQVIKYAGKTFKICDIWPGDVYSDHKRTYELDFDGYRGYHRGYHCYRWSKKCLEPVASKCKKYYDGKIMFGRSTPGILAGKVYEIKDGQFEDEEGIRRGVKLERN